MTKHICPADEMVEIDLPGYLEALEEPCEIENFDLNGKELERNGGTE